MKIADAAVLVRDGKVLISDGPFAETKEQIGGYCLIDCKDLDEAIEVASQIPGARTVLVSRAGEIAGAADPAARGLAAANAFHVAFWVIFVVAGLGALTAAIAFPRRPTQRIEPEPASSTFRSSRKRRKSRPEAAS